MNFTTKNLKKKTVFFVAVGLGVACFFCVNSAMREANKIAKEDNGYNISSTISAPSEIVKEDKIPVNSYTNPSDYDTIFYANLAYWKAKEIAKEKSSYVSVAEHISICPVANECKYSRVSVDSTENTAGVTCFEKDGAGYGVDCVG